MVKLFPYFTHSGLYGQLLISKKVAQRSKFFFGKKIKKQEYSKIRQFFRLLLCLSRASYIAVAIRKPKYIVISLCVGNEFLVGSTHRAHPSPWRNDSHCVCLVLFRGRGYPLSQYGILRYIDIYCYFSVCRQ